MINLSYTISRFHGLQPWECPDPVGLIALKKEDTLEKHRLSESVPPGT